MPNVTPLLHTSHFAIPIYLLSKKFKKAIETNTIADCQQCKAYCNKEKRKLDVTPYVEDLHILIEKFDFESLNCFEIKLEMLNALETRDFDKLSKNATILEEIAKCGSFDDQDSLIQLINAIEQLKRLVNK